MPSKYTTPLHDKVIVITGASSGAGRATALEFAKHGATVVVASRNEEALQELAEECEAFNSKVVIVKTDVTDAESVQHLVQTALLDAGKIDVWVNNAGVLAVGALAETPVEIHTQVIRTNLFGYMHGVHAILPYFKQQRHGIIINNISIGAWFPVPYATGYSASKYGIRGFTEALRGELNNYRDIYICDVYPAFLDTPGVQHAANYTGAALKPAPPVYDPMRVAKAIVRLAQHPRSSIMVGALAPLLKLAHFISPAISRNITAYVMSSYFKHAAFSSPSSGNLFEPLSYGTSIHGGWSVPVPVETVRKRMVISALVVAGITAGFYLVSKKHKK